MIHVCRCVPDAHQCYKIFVRFCSEVLLKNCRINYGGKGTRRDNNSTNNNKNILTFLSGANLKTPKISAYKLCRIIARSYEPSRDGLSEATTGENLNFVFVDTMSTILRAARLSAFRLNAPQSGRPSVGTIPLVCVYEQERCVEREI